ncbi:uncharacterized protein THITE_2096782 [Thermothielavioides terrestris NRRL 8126]|uniref:Uncharacterized protein n=1 Tax=Thermothielavioides terrestris (strain ATCC 38088 / NRRL 8126) TaxID=578455 RepID=G2R998_THETT|nr:uncharacterized protein THITE_2096782 [Thermothielavioides terrestris NRRL 8126]AEO69496.1 hypothetical protein THITE_2096782 [Thermothielavioides terrestris NRRL 8126]
MSVTEAGFPILQPAFVVKARHLIAGYPPKATITSKVVARTWLTNLIHINIGERYTASSNAAIQPPYIISDTVLSVRGDIDVQIEFGGDWLYVDPDTALARVIVKGIAKDGVPFSFYYTGATTVNEALAKVLAFSPDAKTTPFRGLE